ncbi:MULTISPECIES: class I SAM-dependent methyltransferase [unclassified Chelatococcus]|jgi:SAM-dependent methyltransferase|uniref:class I SAM-dependent methyltransferase n=1 Tax=unclassified Chelatococcus TaxID=2638111 RepID=UPI001BCF3B9B|nr:MULTISPECIES: class I SAM-dependent methyltransferase [unclassified Chelatococcus]CAH1657987.1 Methyltransferase family protein [Hyphomicrobiales bacterium]MBS7740749.1 class I SAM-dependent methyltransferase [Chelatococcus sp. HY11]MBX3546017.1 class I SAM-dependent methyltransferase [Chelatococcus sp.]MCO5079644.1 class I SAM-dependent methyltransferase [Chelatococcus sp.]CAH1684272.1 Methyltransferase family protein [Hyphomicrobiales bacterium]
MAERISFSPGTMPYDAMLAAEHVARYLLARPLCTGKRVLDVACGEGYGTSFLRASGATTVVGIDIAKEAIEAANTRFAKPGITFIAGDALSPATFHGHGPFDLITCFETIEHVSSASRLLENLRAQLAPGGAIIISCPNDAIDTRRGIQNPFHQKTYSLQEFKDTTVAVLGPASQWLLGAPLTGLSILEEGNARLATHDDAMDLSLNAETIAQSLLLPAEKEHSVTPESATFFVGVWNATVAPAAVSTPLSRTAYIAPWLEIERLKSAADDPAGDVAHYRELALLSEERAREIRRIATFEKDTLVAEVTELRYFRDVAFHSRAHRIAAAYIRYASGDGLVARMLRLLRGIAGGSLRMVRKLAR